MRSAVAIEGGRIPLRAWIRLSCQGWCNRDRGDQVQRCYFHRDICIRGGSWNENETRKTLRIFDSPVYSVSSVVQISGSVTSMAYSQTTLQALGQHADD